MLAITILQLYCSAISSCFSKRIRACLDRNVCVWNECHAWREETCGMPNVSSFSPSFYYIYCSEAWHLFQTHTFRSRQALQYIVPVRGLSDTKSKFVLCIYFHRSLKLCININQFVSWQIICPCTIDGTILWQNSSQNYRKSENYAKSWNRKYSHNLFISLLTILWH